LLISLRHQAPVSTGAFLFESDEFFLLQQGEKEEAGLVFFILHRN
jgi:hypothetical protein